MGDRVVRTKRCYKNSVTMALNADYKCIPQIKEFVTQKIIAFERDHGCKMLLAVEKSSHVWGTAHSESDNDVHCLMFYAPRQYYSVNNFNTEFARRAQHRKRNHNK